MKDFFSNLNIRLFFSIVVSVISLKCIIKVNVRGKPRKK